MYKFTSPANEFQLYKCGNNRKMQECEQQLNFDKKNTSPANEFLLHKCRYKKEI